jgi:hypothetical protein
MLPRDFSEHPRPGDGLPHHTVDGLGEVFDRKVRLAIEGVAGVESIRDFGGLYIVHGRYLLEAAVALGCTFASMIDVTPRDEFGPAIERAKVANPKLEVEFVHGDFRQHETFAGLRPVDMSLLYEVVLHQENYVDVIANVCRRTRRYICFAQPCIKENLFALPGSATLLQFWPQELKGELRRNGFWPQEPEVFRFQTPYWMWGQTTSHIISVLGGFGWDLECGQVIEGIAGDYWDFPLLRFVPRAG